MIITVYEDVTEADEDNNSGEEHLAGRDNVTYFPLGLAGHVTVTPRDAPPTVHTNLLAADSQTPVMICVAYPPIASGTPSSGRRNGLIESSHSQPDSVVRL